MKKTLAILFTIIATMTVTAQNHLKFNGIPMDETGTVVDYLCGEGFDFDPSDGKSGVVVLSKEDFANLPECTVTVYSAPKSNRCWKITLEHLGEMCWEDIKYCYTGAKKYLTEQYGKPYSEKEEFSSPYRENDGKEEAAFENKKISYATYYRPDGGKVSLKIFYSRGTLWTIKMVFEDKANTPSK